jgi:hypothetical protein
VLTGALTVALVVVAAPWLASHVGVRRWIAAARLDPRDEPLGAALRIVVPARDEATRIEACVASIVGLREGGWSAVIVDDGSGDGTADLARAAAGAHPSVRVVTAPPRPDGWAGKPWACAVGAAGDEPWILFVDADVRLDPRAPASLVACAEAGRRDLLSVFGRWERVTLGERWLVPAFGWVIRGAVDARAVRDGRQAFANGQCLLVRRSVYTSIGGHGAVRGSVLDDVGLARAVRAGGGRLDVRWAPWAFVVRPYRSGIEVLRGFHKNLHVGLGAGRVASLAAAAALVASGVGPLGIGLTAALTGRPALVIAAGLVVLAQVALRVRLDALDARPDPVGAVGHPVAIAVVGATLAASALAPRATWRGRTYVAGAAGSDTTTPSRQGGGRGGAGDGT